MPVAARHDPPSAHAAAGAAEGGVTAAATVGSGMEEYARRCGREEEYEVSIRSVCAASFFRSCAGVMYGKSVFPGYCMVVCCCDM